MKSFKMDILLSKIRIHVNETMYLKDPESSELGLNIIKNGIRLIDELGFEDFTFRKLGLEIGSNEASIYRYFENKNKFLTYLSSWYWGWMEYRLVMLINNIHSPERRLEKAIALIADDDNEEMVSGHFDVSRLCRIVNVESGKSYLTKEVDRVNQEGAFINYKQFVARLSAIVLEISPKYKYPNMLISTLIEGIHLQKFFALHLPGLTNKQKNANYLKNFFTDMVFNTIKGNQ